MYITEKKTMKKQLFPRKTVKCDRSHRDFWECKLCDWKKNTVHLLKWHIRLITISHHTEKQDLLLTNVFYCNIFTVMKLIIWKLQPKRQSRIKGYPVNMINTIAESFLLMPMQKEGVFHSLPQRDVRCEMECISNVMVTSMEECGSGISHSFSIASSVTWPKERKNENERTREWCLTIFFF